MNSKRMIAPFWGVLLTTAILFGNGCSTSREIRLYPADETTEAVSAAEMQEGPDTEETETESVSTPILIWVDVCGAVKRPGVYALPEGSRVFAAIDMAGGLTEEADARSLNRATPLRDGEQIYVLTVEERETQGVLPGPVAAAQGSGKVNLNTATREELMTLPGIGEARANAILQYRELHGPFGAIEEIMNIEGIKEKGFEKIKEEIEV